ncbi:Ig-like domain-containing protein [Microbulbifer sp. TRSA002]|uniref:Ig-like domain-containing protein n=1 Tax=Microbulbifer sp. TRSA002 TaxID=3243382 RepID=UPI00403A3D1E
MKVHFLKAILCLATVSSLYGCNEEIGGSKSPEEIGDSTAPTLILIPTDGSTIEEGDKVLLSFDEPVELADISLSGSMQDLGELYQVSEDSLELRPNDVWGEGEELSLVINAQDGAGNQMTEIAVKYQVENISPTVNSILPQDIRLEKNGSFKIQFSETMDVDSLQLGGVLLEDDYKVVWSATYVENDTLTITPKEYWIAGQERTINVDVMDLVGNPIPTVNSSFTVPMYFDNFAPASVVIGQDNFSDTVSGISAKNLGVFPAGNPAVSSDGKLFITDRRNKRVLVFNEIPFSNGASADFALGVDSLDSSDSSDARKSLQMPVQANIKDGKLIISQVEGERQILIYNQVPMDGTAVPEVVLGAWGKEVDGCYSRDDDKATSAILVDGKLIAVDEINSRTLVWNSIPTEDNTTASFAVGQPTIEFCTANTGPDGNSGRPTARTLADPSAVWSDGNKLAIIDSLNNRILLWNEFPTGNYSAADVVLGQENFSIDDRSDNATEKDLSYPWLGIWSNGIQLFVTDTENNRVLIWDQWPEENYTAADSVLGQSDFVKSAYNDSNQDGVYDTGEHPSASTLRLPTGVFGYKDSLFVTDSANNRVLVFKSQ